MKKLGIFVFAALLFVGLSACDEQKAEGTTETETTAGTGEGTTAATNPAGNPGVSEATGQSATTAQPASTLPLTSIEFYEDNYNFGEIKEGEKVKHTFRFKNTGSNPLQVENVKPSCGCTASDYTKEEIAPGAEGFVEIEFNSANKNGIIKKTVTVTTNSDPRNKILSFSGEVIKE